MSNSHCDTNVDSVSVDNLQLTFEAVCRVSGEASEGRRGSACKQMEAPGKHLTVGLNTEI